MPDAEVIVGIIGTINVCELKRFPKLNKDILMWECISYMNKMNLMSLIINNCIRGVFIYFHKFMQTRHRGRIGLFKAHIYCREVSLDPYYC